MIQVTLKVLRRIIIIIIGFTVMLLGAIMLVTPGPGIVVIIAGLGVLATELVWARILFKRLEHHGKTYARGFIGWLQKHLKSEKR